MSGLNQIGNLLRSFTKKENAISSALDGLGVDLDADISNILTGLSIRLAHIENSIMSTGNEGSKSMYTASNAFDKLNYLEDETRRLQSEVMFINETQNYTTTTTLNAFSNQFNSLSTIVTNIQNDLISNDGILANLVNNEESLGQYLNNTLDKVKSGAGVVQEGLGWFSDFASVIPIIGPTVAGIAKFGARVAGTVSSVVSTVQDMNFAGILDTSMKVAGNLTELIRQKEAVEGFASSTAEMTQYANYALAVSMDSFEKVVALNNAALTQPPLGRYYLNTVSFVPYSADFISRRQTQGALSYVVQPDSEFPSHAIVMLEWPINGTTIRRVTISLGDEQAAINAIGSLKNGGQLPNTMNMEDSIWTVTGSGATAVWNKTSSSITGKGANFDYTDLVDAGETFPLCVNPEMAHGFCVAFENCTRFKEYDLFNYDVHLQALDILNYARYGKFPDIWSGRCAATLLQVITGGVTLYGIDGSGNYTIPSIQYPIATTGSGYSNVDSNIASINSAAVNQTGAAYLGTIAALQIAPQDINQEGPDVWNAIYAAQQSAGNPYQIVT